MPRLLTLFALTAFGCTAAPATAPDDLLGGPLADLLGGGSSDLAGGGGGDLSGIGAYPGGPYGNKVGDTFPNLQWEGYVASAGDVLVNTLPYGNYSMDDARRSGKAYAMVHDSAFY